MTSPINIHATEQIKYKLLLIKPKSKNRENKCGFEPIELGVIAALTPKDLWDIEIVDETWDEIPYKNSYHLIGITATTTTVIQAYEISLNFRKQGIPTVMGGYHVSAEPEEALLYCDCVVIGLAEGNWVELLIDFQNNELKKSIILLIV